VLIWEKIVVREKKPDAWILESLQKDSADTWSWTNDDEEEKKMVNLEDEYKKIKEELMESEKKKQKLFASWDYDLLDEVNDQILSIMVKISKISALIWENT
jgi:hypothetical protein